MRIALATAIAAFGLDEDLLPLLDALRERGHRAEPIAWERIVANLSGSSAAMIVKAAQDAAKAAVLGGQKLLTEGCLQQAVAELRKTENLAPKE